MVSLSQAFGGPEFEFYIFDQVSSINQNHRSGYQLESAEAHWNTGDELLGNPGGRIPYQGGYHAMPPLDQAQNLRSTMVEHILNAGIPVKYHHHEVGGAGQSEIETGMLPLLAAADAVVAVKHIVKMTAAMAGKTATFMAKPLANEAGSGMHFHQYLSSAAGNSLFYDAKGYAQLNKLALFYIGGVLKHAPALLAITNPSTNSYRRLIPGFEAPTRTFFGLANRSAAVRIPKRASAAKRRIEFRPPDATANPYLAMAAQLLAGLDGIEKRIDPRAEGYGPFDVNVFKLPPEQRDRIPSLPSSLEGALDALQADADFLRLGEVFPEDFVDTWTKLKKEREIIPLLRRPHPMEIDLYYDA